MRPQVWLLMETEVGASAVAFPKMTMVPMLAVLALNGRSVS